MATLSSRAWLAFRVLAGLCAGGAAPAAVVDFEDLAVPPSTVTTGGDQVSGGMTFDTSANHSHLAHNVVVSNGTTWLGIDDSVGTNVLTVSPLVAGPFNLSSIDVAEWGNSPGNVPVQSITTLSVTGTLWGGGTLNASFTLDGTWDGVGGANDFETFTFSGWDNLASVVFQGTGAVNSSDYWALDNLVYTPVPEPGSLAGLGLAGLAVLRRRRRG